MRNTRITRTMLILSIISYLIFSLNSIESFDYSVDEPMWVHYGKSAQNEGFILDTEIAPPLPFWLYGLAFKLTGSDFAPRYANIFIFIVVLAATFRLLERLDLEISKRLMITSVLLLNPYFILYSRTSMTDMIYFAFIWMSTLALYTYLSTHDKRYLVSSALAFSLSALTKHISLLFWPPFIMAIIHLQKNQNLDRKDTVKYIALSSTGFVFLALSNITSYLKTGNIYSFGSRILAILDTMPLLDISETQTQGSLITDPSSIMIRLAKYTIAIIIYSAPLLICLKDKNARNSISKEQKLILCLVLSFFGISLFLSEGYMRQLIVIYPVIYLITAKISTEKAFTRSASILMAYCLIIGAFAFIQFDSKIFGSSKDYLEGVPDTKIQMYNYINSMTDPKDIVLSATYTDNMDAKPCLLTGSAIENPPTGTRYIILNQYHQNFTRNKAQIENSAQFTLEKTFEYKNETIYYIYIHDSGVSKYQESTECIPISPILFAKKSK